MAQADTGVGMRFSMFSVLDHHPSRPRTLQQYYRQFLDHVRLAEDLGYESYWAAEHHFHEYGVAPNPSVLLAAAAAVTTRIKLGPAVSVLPFRDPLQVAEDYAMVDQLSGGRLIMGVGSGYLAHEFAGFQVPPAEKRERFDEAVEILRRAWSGERITLDGRYHHYEGAALNVLPSEQPMPPIYVAVLRAEACYHVGRQGNRLMLMPYASVDRMEEIGDMIAAHAKGVTEAGSDLGPGATLVTQHAHVAESDEAARRHAAECFDLYVETRLYAKRQVYDDILRSRLGVFGSVERVVDHLLELNRLGVEHVAFLMDFGAMPAETVARSMRLMAEAVIPEVQARLAGASRG